MGTAASGRRRQQVVLNGAATQCYRLERLWVLKHEEYGNDDGKDLDPVALRSSAISTMGWRSRSSLLNLHRTRRNIRRSIGLN